MKRANKQNPTLIKVTDIRDGQVIGHITCDEFRRQMGSSIAFISDLVDRFNSVKSEVGDPERVEQVINIS